jgi:dipeptidyl aminopeptidase/acylaminoacyl peptidase
VHNEELGRVNRDLETTLHQVKREKDRAAKGETEAKEQRSAATQALERSRRLTYAMQLVSLESFSGAPEVALSRLHDPERCPLDLRDFTWGLWYRFFKRDRLTQKGQEWLTLQGHSKDVLFTAFSPGNKALLISKGNDGLVTIWDAATGRARATLTKAKAGYVISAALAPDGKTLATGGEDRNVHLWDAATGEHRGTLRGHKGTVRSVAFSPSGQTLASASVDQTVKLWEMSTSRERATLRGHSDVVGMVLFSPDDRTLASVGGTPASKGADRTIKLWDVATGVLRASLDGHKGPITSASFSPDGKRLVSADVDGIIWGMRKGFPVWHSPQMAGRWLRPVRISS